MRLRSLPFSLSIHPSETAAAATALAVCLAVFLFTAGAARSAVELRIEGREPIRIVRSYSVDGALYVSCRDLLRALEAEATWDSLERRLRFEVGGTQVTLLIGRPQALVGGRLLRLDEEARLIGGEPVFSKAFIIEVLGPLLGGDVTVSDLGSLEPVNAEATEQARPGSPGAPVLSSRLTAPDVFDVVVIDPGHGGRETGAVGEGGVAEKDVMLALGKQLQTLIIRRLGLRAVLTRDGDYYVTLADRTAIANENGGDLFISLHANWSEEKYTIGFETFFLSQEASDEEARMLAMAENRSGAEEGGGVGIDFLDTILLDMAQSSYLEKSHLFARRIQRNLSQTLPSKNRGVKQAPFLVLMGVNMPAVLVEVGFISNLIEAKRLARPDTRQRIAEAILRAVRAIKERSDFRPGKQEASG